MSKYSDFHRISNKELEILKYNKRFEKIDKKDAILKVLNYYQPQLNKLTERLEKKVSKWEVDFEENVYNNFPHILAVYISNNVCSFHLNEQFSNCGILVSSKTYSYYTNLGIGSLLQCIKEDIAYVFGYSFLSYTDAIWTNREKTNTKLILNTGAKEIFRGHNTRSSNMIAIWIKDLHAYYKERKVTELTEQTVVETETVVETKEL